MNPLVPLDSTAKGSNCPTSKSVVIRLEPESEDHRAKSTGKGAPVGSDLGHKSDVQPEQLS